MDCPICCEALGDGLTHFQSSSSDHDVSETVFRLSCGHTYHNACIIRHLRQSKECPTCRGVKTKPDESETLDDSDSADADYILEIGSDGAIRVRAFQAEVTNAQAPTPWSAMQKLAELRGTQADIQKQRKFLNLAKKD